MTGACRKGAGREPWSAGAFGIDVKQVGGRARLRGPSRTRDAARTSNAATTLAETGRDHPETYHGKFPALARNVP